MEPNAARMDDLADTGDTREEPCRFLLTYWNLKAVGV